MNLYESTAIDCHTFASNLVKSNPYLPKIPEGPSFLYHYTSPNGLLSILGGSASNATLWATRYDSLNDRTEGKIADDVFQNVCTQLYNNRQISEDIFSVFKSAASNNKQYICYTDSNSLRIKHAECDRYIISFSLNSDSLPMWNYYSKGNAFEGFNIRFARHSIVDDLQSFTNAHQLSFAIYPVVYKQEEQKAYISKFLLDLSKFYDPSNVQSLRNLIITQLNNWSLVFKSANFSHEEEVRVIVYVPNDHREIIPKFRTNHGFIIPYIEVPLSKDSVTKINFGPLNCPEDQIKLQLNILKQYLFSKDYCMQVGHSKIPIRF